jgi:hypothetical protein
MALALTLRSNMSQTCSMGLRSGLFRMSLQEGTTWREDVFPVTHSVEIACNNNKLNPMML